MKYLTKRVLPVLFILLILFSCERKAAEPVLTPLKEAGIDGEVLWDRITTESDYRNYGEWPAHAGLRPGQSPHGVWHRVYGNRTLLEALPADDATAPEGSIIVKENFDNNKTLRSITVMAKVNGYDPDNRDWFWAMFESDGTVLAEGSPGGCISCHEGMRSNDFVIINPLDEEL